MLRMLPEYLLNYAVICNNVQFNLCDTYNMSAKESVAYFYIRGHNITQRTTMHTFAH